ncbi:hypothetical protein TRFO_13515 [Tritrichomonas foetus]|uniref:Leucine Rich Repeat family protein n=1 Tax=Tritrichomonas foetus TaxID=1144522 RepID=A0A1J4L234_9EUKA|nr:hypothetical protein TRFO_13515 [Tritrichomonas foetus]|eukprot:OHT16028.1 hypothetical protein TRFO_13515 [Tritrichomonas foetus]
MYDGTFDGLFKAKLRDNGIDYSEDDYKRFCLQLESSFSKGVLDLAGQRIGINILTKLTKVLRQAPHIRVFNLYGNLIRDHGIHSLLQLLLANQQVEVLDIGCNDFTNQAVPCLIDIIKQTKIRSLQIGTTGVAWHNNKFALLSLIDIIDAIQETQRIECLNMSGLKMSYREGGRRRHIAQEMADFIANNYVLKSFSLSDNSFVLKEEAILTAGITKNDRLVYLDFHENILQDPIGPTFVSNLANMKHLSYLDLSRCGLSPESGMALARTLAEPNIITILKLNENDLGDQGICEILDVMITNQTLTEVDLSDNHFGETVTSLLNEVIKYNQILYSLDVSKNSIGDSGAFAIADAIADNETLTKLSLSSCKITDEGAIAIAKSLADNQTLKYFKMSNNFLTCECGYKILEYVKNNEKLFVFDVTATQINHFVIKAINDLSKRNRQIQKEVKLQPLKKQIVQLSIQRTKMPEAEMRLANLEKEREHLEKEVIDTENELSSTQVNADTNIKILKKTIEEMKLMIIDEEKSKEKIAVDREKMINEYEALLVDDQTSIEHEKILLSEYDAKGDKIEALIVQDNEEELKKREAIQKLIDETRKLMNDVIEMTKDPEKIREFEPPQFPQDPEEKDKFFLVDELAELQAQEAAKGKRKTRKTSRKKGTVTGRKAARKKKTAAKSSRSLTYLNAAESPLIPPGEKQPEVIDDDVPRFITEADSLPQPQANHVDGYDEPNEKNVSINIPANTAKAKTPRRKS